MVSLLSAHVPALPACGAHGWSSLGRGGALGRRGGESGLTLTSLPATRGIARTARRSWSQRAPLDEDGGFAQVIVGEPAPAVAAEVSAIDDDYGIDLLTPDGFQLQGLSFQQSIQAVQALR